MHHDVRDLYLVKCNLSVPGRGPISLMITQLLITITLSRTNYQHRKELGCGLQDVKQSFKIFRVIYHYQNYLQVALFDQNQPRSSLLGACGDGKITNACISQTPDQRYFILNNMVDFITFSY